MKGQLQFTFDENKALSAVIDATGEEMMIALMSLEGYICANLNMSVNEVRTTVDRMKSEFQARPLEDTPIV